MHAHGVHSERRREAARAGGERAAARGARAHGHGAHAAVPRRARPRARPGDVPRPARELRVPDRAAGRGGARHADRLAVRRRGAGFGGAPPAACARSDAHRGRDGARGRGRGFGGHVCAACRSARSTGAPRNIYLDCACARSHKRVCDHDVAMRLQDSSSAVQAASDSLAHPGRNTPAAPLPTLLVAPPSPVEQRVSVQSVAGSTPHALQRTAPAAAPQTHSAPAVLSHSPLAAAQLPPLPTGPGAHPTPPKPRSATPRHASGTRAPAPSPASPTPAARVQTASPRHVEAGNLAPLQQAAPVVVADTRDAAAPRSPVRSGAAAEQAARALTPSTERSGTPSTEPDSPRAGYDEAQSSHVRAPPPSPSEGPSTRRIAPVPSPALSPLMADAPTGALQAAVSLAAGFASRASEPAGNADGEHVGDAASADDTIAQRAQSRPEDSQKAQHALAAMAGDAQPRPPDSTGKENTPAGRGAAVAGTPTARGIMSRLRYGAGAPVLWCQLFFALGFTVMPTPQVRR